MQGTDETAGVCLQASWREESGPRVPLLKSLLPASGQQEGATARLGWSIHTSELGLPSTYPHP